MYAFKFISFPWLFFVFCGQLINNNLGNLPSGLFSNLGNLTELYVEIYIYILKIVTRALRPTKVHRARRINKDSQSKPHSKHERRELRKMRGWTTFYV